MNWTRKLQAFLHDPPDKALKISNHEERAKRIVEALGITYSRGIEDILSSAVQRVVLDGKAVIDFYGRVWGEYRWLGYPHFKLPVSAEKVEFAHLSDFLANLRRDRGYRALDEFIENVLETEIEVAKRLFEDGYFKLWNSYPEELKKSLGEMLRVKYGSYAEKFGADEVAEQLVNLPAETRFPEHTIWPHLDFAAAMSVPNPVMVRIKVSPVQDFIKNSRKERDLWAGSHMLSYLVFWALKPVIENFGPDSVIYPHMRGQPLFEKEVLGENPEGVEIANIPNKALAIVPEEKFDELKEKIRSSFYGALREIYYFTADRVGIDFDPGKYIQILEDFFSITIEKVPLYQEFESYDEIIGFLRTLGIEDERIKWFELLKLSGRPQPTELYPVLYEILESATNLSSRRFVKAEQRAGWKCRLCGENLAILGDELSYERLMEVWSGEPLCPVCLCRRFYREFLKKRKGLDVSGFETTTDICLKAFNWIDKFREKYPEFPEVLGGLVKNGEPCDPDMYYEEFWLADIEKLRKKILEWCRVVELPDNLGEIREKALKVLRRAYEEIGPPPRYYAILKLDGDKMGKVLGGRKSEKVSEFVHDALKERFRGILEDSEVEDVTRALSPSLHVAVSQALSRFAVKNVPEIVRACGGDLIYAGGDDVLAILPVDRALTCAAELAGVFSSSKLFASWANGGGSGLNMSGGVVVVHYKHPLRDALERVERLEKIAKESGRNALALGYLKRSGDYRQTIVEWSLLRKVQKLLDVAAKMSKRVVYEVLNNIHSLPDDAVDAYLNYELKRHCRDVKVEDFVEDLVDLAEGVKGRDLKEKLSGLFVLISILKEVMNLEDHNRTE